MRGPPGALFGIDQEAATLKVVPFGKLRVPARPDAGRNATLNHR